jgi:hypothetical protein
MTAKTMRRTECEWWKQPRHYVDYDGRMRVLPAEGTPCGTCTCCTSLAQEAADFKAHQMAHYGMTEEEWNQSVAAEERHHEELAAELDENDDRPHERLAGGY